MAFESPDILLATARELHLSNPDLLALMQDVLSQGKKFRFKAKGASMLPFIQEGDVITTAPTDKMDYRVGDVIAFINPFSGHLVIHRIVAKKHNGFLVRGDGIADHPDGVIHPENVLGMITCVERNSRRLLFGFGPERVIIAWLSQMGVLVPLLNTLAVWRKKLMERFTLK